jgi:hypothetical protein
MLPLTLLAARKLISLLTTDNALPTELSRLAAENAVSLPFVNVNQIILTSAGSDLTDREIQLVYPRICIYSNQIKNAQREKFRSFSGSIAVVAEIWSSGNLIEEADQWIHYYVEALTQILRANVGDWGDGMFFSGIYDVQLQSPKTGGLGYLELAKLTCSLDVSLS